MLDDERFFASLRDGTAELARIVDGDLERAVPTCPGWTFRQLATHLGRGHRWAAQIVATRATEPIPMREVADGKLPSDPARHAEWLNAGADLVVEAVTAAGGESAWAFGSMRPAGFWARRRAHETAVHLADAQLATGREVLSALPPDLAADGVDEWFTIVARNDPPELRGNGQSLHFHATDAELSGSGSSGSGSSGSGSSGSGSSGSGSSGSEIFGSEISGSGVSGLGSGSGEWMVNRAPAGVTVEPGHGKADVAVRGPAASLLLVLTRRLPPSDPAVEVFGDQALLTHWLENTPF